MAALPPSTDFTAASTTEGAFKSAISGQRSFLAGLLGSDGLAATALAKLGALGCDYVIKTAAYTLTSADRGRVVEATGTWALKLPGAGSAGAGFSFALRNTGTGIITVNPNGSQTIDGSVTLDFGPGHGSVIVSTGSGWITLAPKVQASPEDTTPGALMAAGAFGLGLDAEDGKLSPGDDLDALTIQGFWRYGTSTNGAPSNRGVVIHTNRAVSGTPGAYMQIAISQIGKMYTRYDVSSVWQPWVQLIGEGGEIGAITPAPATFTDVSLSGALSLNGNVTGGEKITIADNAVGVLTPPRNGCFALITCRGDHNSPRAQASALVFIDVGTSLSIQGNTGWSSVSSEVSVTTSDLTGTTGTDGLLNLAVQPGVLKLENRLGGSRSLQVTWL